ncbi:MAG: nucleotidyltransferase family protein [Chloroflexi bacterium]|nr:nucleotidyltransferase family protein [Chloroflexota bacterium]
MKRAEAIAILQAHQEELRGMGVRSLAIFGSVARDQARPDSDIDLLVELDGRPIGLFAFIGIQEYLESILQGKVDLVTADALHPRLRDRILGEAVRAA